LALVAAVVAFAVGARAAVRWATLAAVGLSVLVTVVGIGVEGVVDERDARDRQKQFSRLASPPAAPRDRTAEPALPRVIIDAGDADILRAPRVVDRLPSEGVVRVEARGFEEFERAVVEQCTGSPLLPPKCANRFPVQFDEGGRAEFQYLVRGSLAAGGCRVGQPTCTIRVTAFGSSRVGAVRTVLVDRFDPAAVRVTPDTGLAEGQVVDVDVHGLAPGGRATARLCALGEGTGTSRCAKDGVNITVGVDGAGSARLMVGADGAPCGPRRPCVVVVLSGNGFLAGRPAPVHYSLGRGADYDPGRVAAGLALAVILAALGVVLLRTTDWTPLTEATTPELDGTDLETGHSLDELFGTDEELEAAWGSPVP
ncbi:MAG: hypothetical protein ACRDY5_08015, partial [Acidimicrobiales bacterium]